MNKKLIRALATGLSITALSVAVSSISVAQQAKSIELSLDNESIKIQTSAKSVAQALKDIGYEFKEGSRINHDLDSEIKDDMVIEIDTEKNIDLKNAGQLVRIKTYASTVKELLDQEEIKVDSNDIVTPGLNSDLSQIEEVTVDYYDEETIEKEENIPFQVKEAFSDDLKYGEKKVSTEGKNGLKNLTFLKTSKNGQEISVEKTKEVLVKKAIDKQILIGTKEIVDEKVAFKTIRQNDSSLYKGQEKVSQEGQTGLIRETYKNDGKTRTLVKKEVVKKVKNKIVKVGTKKKPTIAKTSSRSSSLYSLRDLQFHGVIRWGGFKYTYYSQRVLPGGGLRIPGRHVNSGGFVADSNGYIVLANDRPKGTILPTPFGYMGKVYDRGTYGNHIDVYTR